MFPFFKQTAIPRVVLSDGQVLDYQIKVSPRTRKVRLRLTAYGDVVVIAPKNYNRRLIERLVYDERDWIARHIKRLQALPPLTRPESLEIRAIGEIWKIEATTTKDDLKRRLSKRGREVLIPWLESLAKETGFTYSNVRIRGQKTRFGSCTRKKVISLNYQLLLLPARLVRYVLIHELCHTVELNHSRAFWALVVQHVPDAKSLRKELRATYALSEFLWMVL